MRWRTRDLIRTGRPLGKAAAVLGLVLAATAAPVAVHRAAAVCQYLAGPTVPAKDYLFIPPHLNNGADKDFARHGPRFKVDVVFEVYPDDPGHLWIFIHADATGTMGDLTTAVGGTGLLLLGPPPGTFIPAGWDIVPPVDQHHNPLYVDTDTTLDSFPGGSVVDHYEAVGDTTSANDAGSLTRIEVFTKAFSLTLRKC